MFFRILVNICCLTLTFYLVSCAPTPSAVSVSAESEHLINTSLSNDGSILQKRNGVYIANDLQENAKNCFSTSYDKYYALGQFYQKRYASDLVFDASVEIEKIKAAQFLRDTLLDSKVIEAVPRTSTSAMHFDEYDAAQHVNINFNAPTFQLNDTTTFYEDLIKDDFLSYYSLKKKVGSWWAYLDLADLALWEKYFWIAYLTEQGFEPEYSDELQLLVLGNFVAAEEALHVKERLKMVPVQVSLSIYRPYSIDDIKHAPELQLSRDQIPEPVSSHNKAELSIDVLTDSTTPTLLIPGK